MQAKSIHWQKLTHCRIDLVGWPGQIGQTSFAALSQTVKRKSSCGASGPANSSHDSERNFEVS
jgi:hypothetical protein